MLNLLPGLYFTSLKKINHLSNLLWHSHAYRYLEEEYRSNFPNKSQKSANNCILYAFHLIFEWTELFRYFQLGRRSYDWYRDFIMKSQFEIWQDKHWMFNWFRVFYSAVFDRTRLKTFRAKGVLSRRIEALRFLHSHPQRLTCFYNVHMPHVLNNLSFCYSCAFFSSNLQVGAPGL